MQYRLEIKEWKERLKGNEMQFQMDSLFAFVSEGICGVYSYGGGGSPLGQPQECGFLAPLQNPIDHCCLLRVETKTHSSVLMHSHVGPPLSDIQDIPTQLCEFLEPHVARYCCKMLCKCFSFGSIKIRNVSLAVHIVSCVKCYSVC
jgi:hypothetical protein